MKTLIVSCLFTILISNGLTLPLASSTESIISVETQPEIISVPVAVPVSLLDVEAADQSGANVPESAENIRNTRGLGLLGSKFGLGFGGGFKGLGGFGLGGLGGFGGLHGFGFKPLFGKHMFG